MGEHNSRVTRRQFLRRGALISAAAAAAGTGCARLAAPPTPAAVAPTPDMTVGASDLVVQPVLTYHIPRRRKGRSWRNWGGVHTEAVVKEETARITGELKQLCASADFGVRALPVARVTRAQDVDGLKDTEADVLLVYAAGGWGSNSVAPLAALGKRLILFLRQSSGPYYLWHEIAHARLLRAHTDELRHPTVSVTDVVVDDGAEILWRLRALYGLKNTLGRRVVCIGGPGGWACPKAPALAKERFQLEMPTVPIRELNATIQAARKNDALVSDCQRDAALYLGAKGVTLRTTVEAVREAFLLKRLFHDLMEKHQTHAITVNGCMGSYAGIMPCLTLTLINDGGRMAYCESDFVVIPSGILMHHIAGKPTYLCNPTFPHGGRMLFAHCTAPRRMDGKRLEPVDIVTHYESDWGAATHVHFRKGQPLTILKPDFQAKRWLALTGKVVDTPFLPTCRAQVEVALDADTQDVLRNLRGFHCMLAYGDYTREVQYAASKVGIDVQILRA